MTLWPTWFESSVCQTPSTPVTIGIATMPATSIVSRPTSSSGIATSSTSRSRNGETTPSAGREDDQRGDRAEPRPVRTKEADDPAEVRLPHRGVGRPLGRVLGAQTSRIGVLARRKPAYRKATCARAANPRRRGHEAAIDRFLEHGGSREATQRAYGVRPPRVRRAGSTRAGSRSTTSTCASSPTGSATSAAATTGWRRRRSRAGSPPSARFLRFTFGPAARSRCLARAAPSAAAPRRAEGSRDRGAARAR